MDNKSTTYRRVVKIKLNNVLGALCKLLIIILIIGLLSLKGYPEEMDWLVKTTK